jgi:beta-glucosidase
VSVTLNLAAIRAASDSPADQDAARHGDAVSNRVFLDPILRGSYPSDLLEDLRHLTDWPFIHDGDLEAIHTGVDVLGVNYYSPTLIAATTPEIVAQAREDWVNDPQSASGPTPFPGTDLAYAMPQDGPYTSMGWRIEAGAFTELLLRVHRDYPEVPLMVTENGAAFEDVVAADGAVHDADRIDYVHGHLEAVHSAIEAGADVRGYFLWSLMDNFEWAWGFSKRFGIVHVDYETLQRTAKDSALWYRDVIAANAIR